MAVSDGMKLTKPW